MKNLRSLLLLVLSVIWSVGNVSAQPDSLVTFTGKLVNSRTGNALPNMKVSYKKLPYESEMGDFTTNSNGMFTAYFRANDQYSLLIENEGYIKLSEIINPLVIFFIFFICTFQYLFYAEFFNINHHIGLCIIQICYNFFHPLVI